MNRERIMYVFTNLLGSFIKITVLMLFVFGNIQVEDLTIYKGLFFAVSLEQNQLVIRYATIDVALCSILNFLVKSSRC